LIFDKITDKNKLAPFMAHGVRRWSDVWLQYDLYVVGQHGVLCEVKWRSFLETTSSIYDLP